MAAKWQQFITAIDALSLKERVLLSCATLLVVLFAIQRLALQPTAQERQRILTALSTKRNEIAVFQARAQQIITAAAQDPDAENRARLETLRAELERSHADLARSTSHLIAPEKVPDLLRAVLEKSAGLRLLGLEGLGAKPLLANVEPTGEGTSNEKPQIVAYRHAVRIRVEGTYLAMLNYLREVEALPWALYWDSAELQVTSYPTAVLSVVVNTLSLSEGWIQT